METIIIRLIVRRHGKPATYIELPPNTDTKFMEQSLKNFKKQFNCNGCITANNIIHLQGDKRELVRDYLVTIHEMNINNIQILDDIIER